jgi:hypothetical protein
MLKWKYGNYQFAINPNSQSARISVVGDEVRTLTGALISQPTGLQESYNISAVFFQPRSRALGQTVLTNAIFVKTYNNQFYALNRTNDSIDIYNQSYVFVSSISLSAVTNKSYMAFDVQPDGIWIVSDNGANDTVYKISLAGALLSTNSVAKTISASGLRYFNGYLWILRTNGTIDKIRPTDFVKMLTLALPYGLYYYGMTSDANYLIVGNNDSYSKIYHVDSVTAGVVNQITFDNILSITDVAYDGTKFYILNNTNQLQIIMGNTVEIDIYNLQNQITGYKFVNLVDDMGATTRVYVSDFSAERRQEYEHLYNVSMTINKIDRG